MIHIFTMYFYIIYFALCAILRRAYAVYMAAAGVVEAKTAASHRGRTGSRREPLTQVYNRLLATWYGNVGCEVSDQCMVVTLKYI